MFRHSFLTHFAVRVRSHAGIAAGRLRCAGVRLKDKDR